VHPMQLGYMARGSFLRMGPVCPGACMRREAKHEARPEERVQRVQLVSRMRVTVLLPWS